MAQFYLQTTVYTPPSLPDHVAAQLEPITGVPSEEEVTKVQSAIRSYHQFANAPSLFDPRIDMELSQHLFDIQMASYVQRARRSRASPDPSRTPSLSSAEPTEQNFTRGSGVSTNNAGSGATIAESHEPVRTMRNDGVQDTIERSNRLAEQTNQLIEQSNHIAERANRLVEQSNYPAEQANKLAELSNGIVERLGKHLEESNRLAKESTQPVEKLGDVLKNINKVLVRIQHAIVRNHKGNTLSALGCLVNEKGETPEISLTTENRTYTDFSEENGDQPFPVVINGATQASYIHDAWLGEFIRFYGIDDTLFEDASTVCVKSGMLNDARIRLSEYLSACLG